MEEENRLDSEDNRAKLPNSGRGPDGRFLPGNRCFPQELGRKNKMSFKQYLEKMGEMPISRVIDNDAIPASLRDSLSQFDPDMSLKEALVFVTYLNALILVDDKSRAFIAERTEGKAPDIIINREETVVIDIEDDEQNESE